MSVLQGNNIDGFTQLASNYDPKPNRRISDNFTSSRSYTPDRKCMVIFSSNHDIEKVRSPKNTSVYFRDS
jgi:hypothetical protein